MSEYIKRVKFSETSKDAFAKSIEVLNKLYENREAIDNSKFYFDDELYSYKPNLELLKHPSFYNEYIYLSDSQSSCEFFIHSECPVEKRYWSQSGNDEDCSRTFEFFEYASATLVKHFNPDDWHLEPSRGDDEYGEILYNALTKLGYKGFDYLRNIEEVA